LVPQPCLYGRGASSGFRNDVDEADLEAIAGEVSGSKLVVVPGRFDDRHAIRQRPALDGLCLTRGQRHPLDRDGGLVLPARPTRVRLPDAGGTRDGRNGLARRFAALPYPDVQMLAAARERVEGNLVDDEVLRVGPESAAGAGQLQHRDGRLE